MTGGIVSAPFGQPAIVSHGSGPLQFRHHIPRRQTEASTEGRRVLLGDTVGKNNLSGNPVTGQHIQTFIIIPGARKLLFNGRTPSVIDFLNQEGGLGFIHHVDRDGHRHIHHLVVL